ncbi:hypothetical protein AGMMS50276_00060 [Synergistales bacterium]|nr:hypothetical protein AGMMS50276_00060 [Synergistales bacterium]
MRMPYENSVQNNRSGNKFGNSGSGYNPRGASRNPFEGAGEVDIITLTERVLKDDSDIGYVTSDGRVMPRNDAFSCGYKDGLELVKKRVWGGDMKYGERVTEFDEYTEEDARYEDMEDIEDLGEAEMTDESGSVSEDALNASGNSYIDVVYSDEALSVICRASAASVDLETGGALIGAWERKPDGSLLINVERASGPGEGAERKSALFSPELSHYRNRVGYYRKTRGWEYLGEWHKHPGSFSSLSATDIKTAEGLISDEGWPLLLLPVITIANDRLFIENHAVVSRQLGGPGVFDAGSFSSHIRDFPSENNLETMVFIDDALIRDFRAGEDDEVEFLGIRNAGESYVFFPFGGAKNATLRLIRAGDDIHFADTRACVTAIVGKDDIHCYHVNEGEILPISHKLIDPEQSVYERNSGLFETTALRDKAVTLVGCGSLGSTIAIALSRAGVGAIHLFDNDKLSPSNVARHQGDLRDLGRSKTAVTRDRIKYINPALCVTVNDYDIVREVEGTSAFEDRAAESDLLICTTDTDDSRSLVNRLAVNMKRKCLQVGLHERAASGIVHLYDPEGEGACFACHRDRILVEESKRGRGVAYSEAADARDLTIQPGLSAQIDMVAQVGALRAIDALTGESSLPDLSIVYVDKTPEARPGKDTEDNGSGDSQNAAQAQRRLQLRVVHLGLERGATCPLCASSESVY